MTKSLPWHHVEWAFCKWTKWNFCTKFYRQWFSVLHDPGNTTKVMYYRKAMMLHFLMVLILVMGKEFNVKFLFFKLDFHFLSLDGCRSNHFKAFELLTCTSSCVKWLQFLWMRWYASPGYFFPRQSTTFTTSSSVRSVWPRTIVSLSYEQK